jgi:SAM-dependent methyltransferase
MTDASFFSSIRTGYDTIAEDYFAGSPGDPLRQPVDRGMLNAFVDLVRDSGLGPVADLGCGPGRLTSLFNSLGLNTFGIDLSPGMIAVARREFPGLRFELASMTSLDLPGASLGGIIAHYSIMHIPDDDIPAVFAAFHRVLAPGGHIMLVFQAGDEFRVRTEAFGRQISLAYHLRPPERVAGWLREAGFAVMATLTREVDAEWERAPRAFVLARKPVSE